jgi:uncharacterized integral membrane protein
MGFTMRPWAWPVTPTGRSKEVITGPNGEDDHKDDVDPLAGKNDLKAGYQKEGVRTGVVVLGIVAVLLVIFILQNDQQGPIDFLFWHFKVRIWAALLITTVLSFVAGYLTSWLRRRRRLARKT